MKYLFNEPVEVDPDNLFNIVQILIELEAEHQFLTEKELHVNRCKYNLFEIYYYENLIGKVMVVPHTSTISRVGIWIPTLLIGAPTGVGWDDTIIRIPATMIMQRLVAGIRNELIPSPKSMSKDHSKNLISTPDNSNANNHNNHELKLLTDKEIKVLIAAAVEKVPDHSWDKKAVHMFLKGYTYKEIGEAIYVTPDRIGNRLSELRKELGESIVWSDKHRKKILILKIRDTV
jgi:hypothetical protein